MEIANSGEGQRGGWGRLGQHPLRCPARKGQNLAHWEGFKRWVEAEQPDYAH